MNTTLIICTALAVNAVCAVFVYGLTFAYFQRRYPALAERDYRADQAFAVHQAVLTVLGGVFLLWLVVACSGFAKYGLKFR